MPSRDQLSYGNPSGIGKKQCEEELENAQVVHVGEETGMIGAAGFHILTQYLSCGHAEISACFGPLPHEERFIYRNTILATGRSADAAPRRATAQH